MLVLTLATALLLPAAALQQTTDTTVAVQRGQRLEVAAHSGSITVRGWNRNAVRIRARTDEGGGVDVDTRGSRVSVSASGRRGGPVEVAFEITAPAWMGVSLSGVETDMTVSGLAAPVEVETVQGGVDVDGGVDQITLHSVQGSVTLRNARGRIEVGSVNEELRLTDISGQVSAETVNGDVTLSRVTSASVAVTTVNGDVTFSGPIAAGGRYSFATHNGDVTLELPGTPNAGVYVSTFQGDFESDFPVTLTSTRRKRFNFTLGSGSARIELESFQGTIALRRAAR
ncbi:MAG TPA: DUF4097 family beta strand repeat-containing protein [Gemmatimonadales bacterium]|nr:DUF4097 family beta strand repeat-containing protein [Gemmatimonadales bacterium]